MIKFIFIAFFFLLSACSSGLERVAEPDDLIPKEQMVAIITELVKLESYLQSSYPSVAEYNKVMINSGNKIFEKFGITHAQFEGSIDYYASHQKMMKEIYNEALDNLNSELGELEALKERDSIK